VPERVRITDVAPRDGLQNEPGSIPTPEKIHLVELLARTGADEVEVSSFVSPRWVPQLGDAEAVFDALAASKPAEVLYSSLVPNEHGMLKLLQVNERAGSRLIGKASVFTAASETFSRRNTNASIEQSLERFAPVLVLAKEHGIAVRGYVSCAIACPFEGPIEPGAVVRVAERLLGLGVDEIDLGDTIGAGTPETVARLLEACRASFGDGFFAPDRLTVHLHDTFGRAAECVRTSLEMGVRSFDGSAGGLGGCPYASTAGKRAPGNIATETLVHAVQDAGYETGVDLDTLAEASGYAVKVAARARTEGNP